MKKVYEYLNKDIKEYNKYILSIISIIILILTGIISYKVNNTYSKWEIEILSNNTLSFTYEEPGLDASGANEPLLTNNMIPVYYDSDASTWKKADSTNSNETYKWYDYDSKIWANAVTTTSTNRQNYIDANPGTPIPMSDINTMWVWIPRYTYTYFNTNTPFEIQINFENGTNSSGTISCTDASNMGSSAVSETCTDTTNGSLVAGTSTYTHPAFTFGDQDLTGLWVGKFEVSSDTICTAADNSPLGSGCNLNTIKPLIKPNVTSWRGAQVSTYFETMRNMEQGGNIYGFPQASTTTYNTTGLLTNDNNNIDTHMMKNMEWGAVAYLSHSKYGINGEIYINNSSGYYTGRSAGMVGGTSGQSYSANGTYEYNNVQYGYNASTTGNIYGIYDMSGGAWEYMMASRATTSGVITISNAGTFSPQAKYYNLYTNNSVAYTDYNKSKLGDAIKEMAPTGTTGNWYGDDAFYLYSTDYWFHRGAIYSYSSRAGVFAFGCKNGDTLYTRGSRTSLVFID